MQAGLARTTIAFGLGLVSGCATLDSTMPDGLAPRAHLVDVPFHPQLDHHCGPAALMTVLGASNVRPVYEELVDRVYVPGLEGSLQVEMLAAARAFDRIPFRLPGTLDAVLTEVEAGRPVLILQNLRLRSLPAWHYAVVVGYDRDRRRILMRSGTEREAWTRAGQWLRQWDWAGRWAAVVLPPGELPVAVDRAAAFRALADFDEQGAPEGRLLAWRSAVERWPDAALARVGVGNAEYAAGDLDSAGQAFETALALDAEHWPARINLAQVRIEQRRGCEALATLETRTLPTDHPLADALSVLRGNAAEACGESPASKEAAGQSWRSPPVEPPAT